MERNRELFGAFLPLILLGEETMSEFAERAMGAAESSANPIRHLTDECRIGVIDANELSDVRSHSHRV